MEHKMIKNLLSFVMTLSLLATGCYYDNQDEMYGGCDTANVTYTKIIAPIMQNCVGCHGAKGASANISLHDYNSVKACATLGRLSGSLNQSPGYIAMPPSGKLGNCDLKQLDKWIINGMPQ